MKDTENIRHPASFRDPSGFIFTRDGVLHRQVNHAYRANYDHLMQSGLHDHLVSRNLLVAHEETDAAPAYADIAYKVLKPVPVPFISYPYEWSFSMLKDAALATVDIHLTALEHGMALKDASAYNIQFVDARPVLLDTLSFEVYQEGSVWVAYRQFCQHFLAPLALMSHRDVRLATLLRSYIDGLPLDLAADLLPRRTWLKFGLATHLRLHAKAQARYAKTPAETQQVAKPRAAMSRHAMLGLVESLRSTVAGLVWKSGGTEWADYYDNTNYSDAAQEAKRRAVAEFVERAAPNTVWDLGANTGAFSRIAAARAAHTVAFDIDPSAVEQNYRTCIANKDVRLLPLVMDLTNPSPALGWHHRERDALLARGPADLVMALALVHHLAISNNVPLPMLASFFAEAGRMLIIEFVPKTDSQVRRLLASRTDIFDDYTREGFEKAFSTHFAIVSAVPVEGSERTLYLMERKG